MNGESYSTEQFITMHYTRRTRTLGLAALRPVLDITQLAVKSERVTFSKIDPRHLRVIRARTTFMLEIRKVKLPESTIYFLGNKSMLIASDLSNTYCLVALSGIIEGALNRKDISKYINAIPCTMEYSGKSVRTVVEGVVKTQIIVDTSDDIDIRINNLVEQSMGQSADIISEDVWVGLMAKFGHTVESSRPHYYVDVSKGYRNNHASKPSVF